jgi:hypothetical protein
MISLENLIKEISLELSEENINRFEYNFYKEEYKQRLEDLNSKLNERIRIYNKTNK